VDRDDMRHLKTSQRAVLYYEIIRPQENVFNARVVSMANSSNIFDIMYDIISRDST